MKQSKNAAFGGVLISLAIALLYFASVMPVGQIGVVAIAGICPAIEIMRNTLKNGIIVYLSISLLSFFILPSKSISILFFSFFGLYSIIKYFIEIKTRGKICWLFKLIFLNILIAFYYFMMFELFVVINGEVNVNFIVILIVANIAFISYDIVFSKLICFIKDRIRL